ncbi:MAG TPA: hypothetical protein VGQ38_14505 [Gaiellaceae bacterium]|nr:hypothetical protein [Gaiellaceae bacterium]
MTTETDRHTNATSAAADAQAKLTQSVGTPLTRESHDAEVPLWKRWLKRAPAA